MKNSGNQVDMDILNSDALNWAKKWGKIYNKKIFRTGCLYFFFLVVGTLSFGFISNRISENTLLIVYVIFILLSVGIFKVIEELRKDKITSQILEDFNKRFPKNTHERSRVLLYLVEQPKEIQEKMDFTLRTLRILRNKESCSVDLTQLISEENEPKPSEKTFNKNIRFNLNDNIPDDLILTESNCIDYKPNWKKATKHKIKSIIKRKKYIPLEVDDPFEEEK